MNDEELAADPRVSGASASLGDALARTLGGSARKRGIRVCVVNSWVGVAGSLSVMGHPRVRGQFGWFSGKRYLAMIAMMPITSTVSPVMKTVAIPGVISPRKTKAIETKQDVTTHPIVIPTPK